MLRKALLAGIASLFAFSAEAQIGPQTTVYTYKGVKPTYYASVNDLALVTATTDFIVFTPSTTKVTRINRISCSGTATAAGAGTIQLLRRSTADLTGTSTTITKVSADSTNAASTAVVKAYTANPGTLGTLVGVVRAATMNFAVGASGNGATPVEWTFDWDNEQPLTLRSGQILAIGGAGTIPAAGAVVNCNISWTEQ